LESLDAVIWSHWHFDHAGDMSKFPPSAKIVVGEGFKDNLLPCYPSNPKSALLESDYERHELVRSFSMTASRLVTSVHMTILGMVHSICLMFLVMLLVTYVALLGPRKTHF
jgi:metal-dependent hydrolase (beta-lactamase superfamily II)